MKNQQIIRPLLIKGVGEEGIFEGYGSVFDVKDWYGHIIVKGAFDRMLEEYTGKGTWPFMFADHDHRKEIGEWLDVGVDEHGLKLKGQLWIDGKHPDQDALKKYRSLKKKNGTPGLSIGWRPYPGGMEYDKEQDTLILKSIYVGEISPVHFPANEKATVTNVKSIRDFERFLRDAGGYSKKEATCIASRGFEYQRDAEEDETEIKEMLQELTRITRG